MHFWSIWHFPEFWKFQVEFLRNGTYFVKFDSVGCFSHLILVPELNFALWICKFQFFWNSCEIPEFIVEFWKIDLGYDMGCQFHLFSTTEFKFRAHILISTQLKKFEIYFDFTLLINVLFFFNYFIFVKLLIVAIKLNSVIENKWKWHPISYPKSIF